MKIFMILLLMISLFIHSSFSALRFDELVFRIEENKSKSEFFFVIS
jgi:hypothetical protein